MKIIQLYSSFLALPFRQLAIRKIPIPRPLLVVLILISTGKVAFGAIGPADAEAADIIAATGVQGGFVVHLGAGEGQLTEALHRNSSYQVQGLEREAGKVQIARERLLAD